MKNCFLSLSFKNRENLNVEIATIIKVLKDFNFNTNVFVDKYYFGKGEEKKMMEMSCNDISASDLIIAEVSDKAISVGIEVGFAVALKKKVIYIRHLSSEYSSTIGGIVANHLVYNNKEDLEKGLNSLLKTLP